jgi:hypothetical protein
VAEDALAGELTELLRKYREMLRMRLEDEAHPGGDPRREMVALAGRFPGALRELDQSPLSVLRGRIEDLSACIERRAPPAPWMRAMTMFHRLMRGALAAKRWLGAARPEDFEPSGALLDAIGRAEIDEDAREWASDLAAIAAPPRGKLTDLVFERIARTMAITTEEARHLVLGPRREKRPPGR